MGLLIRKKIQVPPFEKMMAILSSFTFRNDSGEEIEWTEGQKEILYCILARTSPKGHKRIHIQTPTRYGKSASVAAGVIIRASHKHEKWAIVAPSQEKAQIIMDYAIRYALDNPTIMATLEIDKSKHKLDRLKRERSRDRLTFRLGGEIRIFSADSRNKIAAGNAVMGFGAANIIEDEAALIDDDIHTKILRMLGDSKDNFLVKIGNPFRRNHFLKSFQSNRFYRILIDWRKLLQEGRATEDFINEMREEDEELFDILYEAKFPAEDRMDSQGWVTLIPDTLVESAMTEEEMPLVGKRRLGQDVSGGGRNYNVSVIRAANYAEVVMKDRRDNTIELGTDIVRLFGEHKLSASKDAPAVFIDRIGVGRGVTDWLKMQIPFVRGVANSERAADPDKFANVRAESYWRLREWLMKGGKLSADKDWYQLTKMKYKTNGNDQIVIMSKIAMLKQGIESPDVADALALTFVAPEARVINDDAYVQPQNQALTNDDPFDDPVGLGGADNDDPFFDWE